MRLLTFASAALIAAALSGCAYKPLDAPCSMSEGGAPVALQRPAVDPLVRRENAVQALSYAAPEQNDAPTPFRDAADECGPLRPINAARLR